jgi:hypothetical protein
MKKQIEQTRTKIADIGEQLKDTSLPNWHELASQRNSLSVDLKRLTQRVLPKNTSHIESWNLREFNI